MDAINSMMWLSLGPSEQYKPLQESVPSPNDIRHLDILSKSSIVCRRAASPPKQIPSRDKRPLVAMKLHPKLARFQPRYDAALRRGGSVSPNKRRQAASEQTHKAIEQKKVAARTIQAGARRHRHCKMVTAIELSRAPRGRGDSTCEVRMGRARDCAPIATSLRRQSSEVGAGVAVQPSITMLEQVAATGLVEARRGQLNICERQRQVKEQHRAAACLQANCRGKQACERTAAKPPAPLPPPPPPPPPLPTTPEAKRKNQVRRQSPVRAPVRPATTTPFSRLSSSRSPPPPPSSPPPPASPPRAAVAMPAAMAAAALPSNIPVATPAVVPASMEASIMTSPKREPFVLPPPLPTPARDDTARSSASSEYSLASRLSTRRVERMHKRVGASAPWSSHTAGPTAVLFVTRAQHDAHLQMH